MSLNLNEFQTKTELDAALAGAISREFEPYCGDFKSSLILLSGGSVIDPVVQGYDKACGGCRSNHAVSLTDERYGKVNHSDSNWRGYITAGIDLDGEPFNETYRILEGKTLQTTAADYDKWLQTQLAKTQRKVGVFGVGADGHTAGIKPMEKTKFKELFITKALATSYKAEDFERITITVNTIRQLDVAYLYASTGKESVIKALLNSDKPANEMPVQLLKRAKQLMVYTLK